MPDNPEVWGQLASIDLHSCDPALIRDAGKIRQFVVELCERIGMRRYGECHVVDFGEDPRVAGFSMFQLIETSCISGHFANQSNNAYLDIFSCKHFDPKQAAEFCRRFFKAQDYNLNVVQRR